MWDSVETARTSFCSSVRLATASAWRHISARCDRAARIAVPCGYNLAESEPDTYRPGRSWPVEQDGRSIDVIHSPNNRLPASCNWSSSPLNGARHCRQRLRRLDRADGFEKAGFRRRRARSTKPRITRWHRRRGRACGSRRHATPIGPLASAGFFGFTTCAISTGDPSARSSSPSAVKRGTAHCRIGVVQGLDQLRRRVNAPLADDPDQHDQRTFRRPRRSGAAMSASTFLSARAAIAAWAASATSASPFSAISKSAGRLATFPRRPTTTGRRSAPAAHRFGPRPARRAIRCDRSDQPGRAAPAPHGPRWCARSGPPAPSTPIGPATRGRRPRQSASCPGRPRQLLDQQRNARRAACQDRAARRFQFARLGNFGLANFVINLGCFAGLAVAHQSFGAQDAAFGHAHPNFGGGLGQRLPQRFCRRIIRDVPQGHRGRCATRAFSSFSRPAKTSTACPS